MLNQLFNPLFNYTNSLNLQIFTHPSNLFNGKLHSARFFSNFLYTFFSIVFLCSGDINFINK